MKVILSCVRCILFDSPVGRFDQSKRTACSVLGEQPPDERSWVKLNKSDGPDHDVTTNIRLQLNLPDKAKELWKTMEDSAYDRLAQPET